MKQCRYCESIADMVILSERPGIPKSIPICRECLRTKDTYYPEGETDEVMPMPDVRSPREATSE